MTIKIEELTHAYISAHCDFERQMVLTNYFHSDWEADIFLVNADGTSHEIEIKFSKSDFKNDFKKKYTNAHTGEQFLKHDKICSGDYICNHFSFLLPMGLIAHSDVPDHCGIIEFYHDEDRWETTFTKIRAPHPIHDERYWDLVDKDLMMRRMALQLLSRKFELKARHGEFIFKNPFEVKKEKW